jgi:hypothetical protein
MVKWEVVQVAWFARNPEPETGINEIQMTKFEFEGAWFYREIRPVNQWFNVKFHPGKILLVKKITNFNLPEFLSGARLRGAPFHRAFF